MKILCCVLVASLCAAGVASARPEMYVLGGPVLADLGGDGAQFGRDIATGLDLQLGGDWRSEKSVKLGPDLGVGLHLADGRSVTEAIEVRYVRRGTRYTFRDASGTYTDAKVRLNLDYVEIPLLAVITPPNDLKVRPMFLAGLTIAFRARSNLVAESGGQSRSQDIADEVGSTRTNGLLGAGVRIETARDSALLVQLRYAFGTDNLFRKTAGYDVKSRDLSFLAGYAFGI